MKLTDLLIDWLNDYYYYYYSTRLLPLTCYSEVIPG